MVEVKIYTTNYCGFCRAAKSLLAQRGAQFEEIDVTEDPERRTWLVEQTGQRTVPQIFIAGVPVGGFSDLRALDGAGKLAPILDGSATPERVH